MSQNPDQEVSLTPSAGWHCSHIFYGFDRLRLRQHVDDIEAAKQSFIAALDPEGPDAPARLQTSLVSGPKADFAVMMLDPDPLRLDAVHQRLMAGPLGPALDVAYSFISLTEVSEYVPSVEQFGARLVAEGDAEGSPAYEAKVKAYAGREEAMRRQRLYPELPEWPSTCFYPMNKKRKVGENWFTLDYAERYRLMAEHGRSGMTFAGRVTQLITVSVGLDDWEWGVTLWARNPEFLKEIVYKMRFDEASARYAEFGPFYTSYVCQPAAVFKHCRLG
ncbi:MAG: heme-dependent peroxidase [Planctomycetales bacterium]|nr:heme-dependent peroxidase [Planctomycetales bacterium]